MSVLGRHQSIHTRAETGADADAIAIGDSDDAVSRRVNPACGGARLRGVSSGGAHRTAPLGSRSGRRKSGQRFDPGGESLLVCALSVVEYFLWLAEEGLEREPNHVWDSLVAESADIEASVVFPALRRAYSEGLADPQSMSLEELTEVESALPGRMLEAMRERQPPIDDVAVATSWWSAFEKHCSHETLDDWDDERQLVEPEQPYRAPVKVGRNESCPCGSGKTFKKCCGR